MYLYQYVISLQKEINAIKNHSNHKDITNLKVLFTEYLVTNFPVLLFKLMNI